MRVRLPAAVMLAVFLCTGLARADALFATEDPLEATLRGPLSKVYDDSPTGESRERTGQWIYDNAEGKRVKFKVRFRQRGNMRRQACFLPPLRLNFVKSELKGTLFDGQDKLKLVGVCDRQRQYRDFLMLEYLAYRAYALLTPASFDTRLLELRYIDSAGSESMRRNAFLIEDIDALAARLDAPALKVERAGTADLDKDAAALLELFSLMIGNTDYSTIRGPAGDTCCHNVKLFQGVQGIVPVPYDFDGSGLVDAPYALPAKLLPINDVRTRYFNGICKAPEHFQSARAVMLAQKDGVMALFEDHEGLSSKARSKTVRYVREFFAMLESDAAFERDVVAACVGPGARD
ncbi:MAG: hypothetical protein AAFV30_09835 [Pseudomonadota bacterium]